MPIGPQRLPFFEHVAELRQRLIVVVITIVVLSLVLYANVFYEPILAFVLKPVMPFLPAGKLNVFGPFESFTFRFKVALYASIVVGSPIIIWQTMAFFLPALKPNERRWVVPTFIAAVLLFLSGNAFAYFVLMKPAFQFMFAQGGDFVSIVPSADKFLVGITMMLIGFGAAFEVPILVFYSIGFGLVTYRTIRANWRYVYVALTIIAAVATPDWSPITMGSLAACLIFLYEGSLLMSRLVYAKKIKEQEAEYALEQASAQ